MNNMNNNLQKKYIPSVGEVVWVKAPSLKATVLKELGGEDVDTTIGRKFLVRDSKHSLRQVYDCEIDKVRDPKETVTC